MVSHRGAVRRRLRQKRPGHRLVQETHLDLTTFVTERNLLLTEARTPLSPAVPRTHEVTTASAKGQRLMIIENCSRANDLVSLT